MTRNEALAKLDGMIVGLKGVEQYCNTFRTPTFTKFGIFVKRVHTDLQEIRWAL